MKTRAEQQIACVASIAICAFAITNASIAQAATSPFDFDAACDTKQDDFVTLCLGQAYRPRKGHQQTVILAASTTKDRVKLTFFGDAPDTASSFGGDYSFDLPNTGATTGDRQQSAAIVVTVRQMDHMKIVQESVVQTQLSTGGPCTADVTSGGVRTPLRCTSSKQTLSHGKDDKVAQWSGTFSEDLSSVFALHASSEESGVLRTRYVIHDIAIRTSRKAALVLCPSGSSGCEDKDVKKLAKLPIAVDVVYQRSGDGYAPKPSSDVKGIQVQDGPGGALDKLVRSRIGLDATDAWSPWVRASFAFGQSSSDQKNAADKAGDAVFRSALQNKDIQAGALAGGNAVLDADKTAGSSSGSKGGFLSTDAGIFSFVDVADSASALAVGRDSVKKSLTDMTAGGTPLDLTSFVAPDGAFKIVRRDDGPGARGWRTRAAAVFSGAVGDEPRSVADGGATVTAVRDDGTSRTSLAVAYSVANRVQNLIDYRDPTTITFVPLTPTVSIGFPYPIARVVHVVDEGVQFTAEHDVGLSTYLRASAEPGRAGSDFFAAERWQFGASRPLPSGPGFRSTTVALYGGWRATGAEYYAPIGSRNDLAQTYGPFFIGHIESVTVAQGQQRQRHLTYTASRWDSALGLQQFVSRLDGSFDFQNRLAFTGTTTRSGATLFLATREQVAGTPIPLGRQALFPLDQGSVGLSWKPPAGEFSITDGFSYTTTCKNVATTLTLPPGVTLPTGSLLPECVPNGHNVIGGTVRLVSGPLTVGAHYGTPTFATSRTPDLNTSIERAGALRYKFLNCNVVQIEYVNRSGFNGLTDAAGAIFGASLEIHTFKIAGFKPIVTFSYAESKSFPIEGPPNTKSGFQTSPEFFHRVDDKGC